MKPNGTCKGKNCGAEIVWVKGRNGNRWPLDPEPCGDGDVVIEGDEVATILSPEAAKNYFGEKYRPHWKSCPNHQDFRRRRGGVDQIDEAGGNGPVLLHQLRPFLE